MADADTPLGVGCIAVAVDCVAALSATVGISDLASFGGWQRVHDPSRRQLPPALGPSRRKRRRERACAV